MEPIVHFEATAVALPADDIDTDQIIPARFLKITDKAGLGDGLFADWRYLPDGTPRPEFVLNRPDGRDAGILLAGHNFGCGSSREHASWALLGFGLRAVVSTGFADIFRNNALKNGMIPITVPPAVHARLLRLAEQDEPLRLRVDLESLTLTLPEGEAVPFPMDSFARHCLIHGVDQLGFLLSQAPAISAHETARPARIRTTREEMQVR